MAPPYTGTHAYHSRYERSHAIAALADLETWKSYSQIARELGIPRSTVQSVVKQYRARGHIGDARRSGQPSRITKDIKLRVEKTVQDNLRASLNEITESIQDLDISRTTVNKATKQLGFQLRIPQKKPFLTPFAKVRRKYWSRKRLSWTKMD